MVHYYSNVPMPPAITMQACAGKDAGSLCADLTGAIERLGPGLHLGALVDVPVPVKVDGKLMAVTGSNVHLTNNKVDTITLKIGIEN